MASRKRKKVEEESSGPGWIVIFSDLMTLLLAFFVLLYSFSSMDAIKFKQVASSLQSSLLGEGKDTIFESDTPPGDVPLGTPQQDPEDEVDNEGTTEQIQEILELVEKYVKAEGLESEVEVALDIRGVLINIKDSIMFEPAKAELKPKSLTVLSKLSNLFYTIQNEIIIEGHTDNRPINSTVFPSNWELSVVRSTTVVRYFIEKKGHNPQRFTASGYGEYRPVAPNDSIQNRSLNRRVNFIIVIEEEGEIEIVDKE